MTEIPALPQKVVNRKIIVLKSRFDPATARLLGEKVKVNFFVRLRFLKPKPEEIRVVSVDKYYEPYIVVGGKYAIDYCKRRVYAVKVDEETREIVIAGKKFKPEPLSPERPSKAIKFEGEGRFHYEDEAYFILDKMGREVAPEQLSYAPSEEQPGKIKEISMKLGEVKISPEQEIDVLRSKIVNRPSDADEVIWEWFEVNERAVIYIPMYKLTFQNLKTGKEAIAKIDGITGKFVGNARAHGEDLPPVEEKLVEGEPDLPEFPATMDSVDDLKETITDLNKKVVEPLQFSKMSEDEETMGFPATVVGEVFHVGDNVTAVVGDIEIPSGTTVLETLVVKGQIKIGTDCRILGKVKALRDIVICNNTTIEGNVVSGGKVVVGPNSVIHGSVESAGDVEIGENAVIEGGVRSKSSVILNQFASVRWTVNAAKGTVVRGSRDD